MKRAYIWMRSPKDGTAIPFHIAAKPLTGLRPSCVRPACGFFVSISVYWGTYHGYRLLGSRQGG